MKRSPDRIHDEFREFAENESAAQPSQGIPQGVTDAIFAAVRADLQPPAARVFSKLLLIHSAMALLSLSVCPQFGYRLTGEGMGLMHLFMAFGTYGCMVACGAFFTGMSLFAAALLLRAEEIRLIRTHRALSLGALTLLSLGFFVMIDADVILGLAATWFAGSLFGSWLTLELGWRLRFGRVG